jgi:hypothetical protein
MTVNKTYPLANDANGNPISLPPEAVGWRVMRKSGKQGRPQCVYDPATGAQLVLALDATIDDLRDYGPGVYKLYAIDRDGKIIPGIVAQTEVPFERPDDDEASEPYGSKSESAALIRHLVDANVRVMEAMASAFGRVRPVEQPQIIAVPEAPANGQPNQQMNLAQLMASLPEILQTLKAAWAAAKGQPNGESPTEGNAP